MYIVPTQTKSKTNANITYDLTVGTFSKCNLGAKQMYPPFYTLTYRGLGLALVTFMLATRSSRANGHNKMGFVFFVLEIFSVSINRC